MGQKPFPPPPPRPDPRLTPQSVHGNIPPLEQQIERAHRIHLARLLKQHRQDEQDLEAAYKLEMERIAGESRPRPMDISTHDPYRKKPHVLMAERNAELRAEGFWQRNWRYCAAFWIVIDIALTGVALYISFSSKF